MSAVNRFKKIFLSSMTTTGNRAFDYYYASALRDEPVGGLHAGEARRDFEKVRHSIHLVRTYS